MGLGPSLYDILDQRFKQYFEEHEVLDIFSQVCLGVAHLHSLEPPVAHRDIKVSPIPNCKISISFGNGELILL
jgi:AP2-associated kinase